MEEKILFEMRSAYRDPMRVRGYSFGAGARSACVVGAMRGNEVQQMYICSQLVHLFSQLESQGSITGGCSVLVVPVLNAYSMNIGKRFWPTDGTDINRMFPGYALGETTQRVAAGVFEQIKDYAFGIQLASFYMQGSFIPHVRMMKTGYEDTALAGGFGLPYIYRREPKPYDTTTLNYNWQVWGTKAFSVYTNATDTIDPESAAEAIDAILRFLSKNGVIRYRCHGGFVSQLIEGSALVSVKSGVAGLFVRRAGVWSHVRRGDLLAEIMDPCTGQTLGRVLSPTNGIVFFHASQPVIYAQTPLFRLIPTDALI